MKIKLLKKADIITAAVIFVIGIAVIAFYNLSGSSLEAVITIDGEVYSEIDLSSVDDKYTIKTPTDPQTEITVEKNCIYFSSSECDNKLCVKSGKLTSKGATAVCLPAKVVVSIESNDDIDAVTY